ncbi:C-C chemokine receptor type 6 [Bagarius yarrelli]|uniref:C-C chemokine receptor type 6 n=1 Tax=Bagarius yarrelli TaxID=175774 RepID=A0A556U535_BAGYA|nr:C-C chemokine receptor type 6 [Bagarius yarrelli]
MTDIYLVNVAVADLLFVLALPLIIYNEQYNWSMGTWACKILRGSYSMNLYSSLLLLACISGDRYVAIVKARCSYGIRSRAQIFSRLICIIIWLFTIVLSMPTFIYSNLDQEYVNETTEIDCSLTFETNGTAHLMKILLPSMQVSVGFFIPLLVMGFCYCSIIYTLLRVQNYQRHKALRVILAVVLMFILCHLPYNVVLLIHTARLFHERECNAEQNIHLALSVTRSIAYLHCCLNPILYAFIGVKFRNHFSQIVIDLWCLGKRYFSSRRSSQQTSELYTSAHKSISAVHHENPSSFTM